WEERADRVDAVGDHEHRAVGLLGEEVAHRTVERAGHPYRRPVAVACDEREGAGDGEDAPWIAARDALARLLDRAVRDALGRRVRQIHDTRDRAIRHGNLLRDRNPTAPC